MNGYLTLRGQLITCFCVILIFLPTLASAELPLDLSLSISSGDIQAVRDYLKEHRPDDTMSRDGSSLLVFAAFYGDVAIARLLLESGADIEHLTGSQETALLVAARENKTKIMARQQNLWR